MSLINPLGPTVDAVAGALQTDDVTAKLMVSLVLGYPIAIIYSLFIKYMPNNVKNLYILCTGLALCIWNFKLAVFHMIFGITTTFSLLSFRQVDMKSVLLVIVFNMGQLFYGYIKFYETPDLITWTTPYCILALRLIGMAWDLYDGQKPKDKLSEYQKRAACTRIPTVLEFFAFCFVPTAFIAGPQFPFRHYQMFISRDLRPTEIFTFRSWRSNLINNKMLQRLFTRLASAAIYLVFYVKVTPLVPKSYFTDPEFLHEKSLAYKLTYAALYSKVCITRYFICWLIGEGACVILGLGCTGRVIITKLQDDSKKDIGRQNAVLSDSNAGKFHNEINVKQLHEDLRAGKIKVREADHIACANVSVLRFEFATRTDGLVSGHNINTNKWMLEYVYKRFRFLNNKYLSQVFTLAFLAFWHGLYTGYYVCFFLEFITVVVEKDMLTITRLSVHADKLYNTFLGNVILSIAGKIHVFYLLGSPLVAFNLLHHVDYVPYVKSIYFIPFIYFLWPLIRPAFKTVFKKKKVKSDDDLDSKSDFTTIAKKASDHTDKDSPDESSLRQRKSSNSQVSNSAMPDHVEEIEDALDLATKLRRYSTAAVNEWKIQCDEEEYEESEDRSTTYMAHLSANEEP